MSARHNTTTQASEGNRSTVACHGHAKEATSATARWTQLRSKVHMLMTQYGYCHRQSISASVGGGIAMLHKDFWLEALDERHRYGFHLRAYHHVWKTEMDKQTTAAKDASFFHWLDHGAGQKVELPECTREALETMCVQYCDDEERKQYEVRLVRSSAGTTLLQYIATGDMVHTDEQCKWIFVIDVHEQMYVGRKRKGRFHHSSFVAGAPIYAAGKITVQHGRIHTIEPHSGHFKPTLKNLVALRHFLATYGLTTKQITFLRPKKWSCPWPFEKPAPRLADPHDLPSDTDEDEDEDQPSLHDHVHGRIVVP